MHSRSCASGAANRRTSAAPPGTAPATPPALRPDQGRSQAAPRKARTRSLLRSDTTINYAINSDVCVGLADNNGNPPFSPTVNLVVGGSIDGGTFGQSNGVNFLDETTGAFTFLGTGLSFAPDPSGKTIYGGTDYTLTGLLQDGNSITGDVIEVASGATMFTLTNAAPIPEASTAALVGLGALCLVGLMLVSRLKAQKGIGRRGC